jgi:hypothetical protein
MLRAVSVSEPSAAVRGEAWIQHGLHTFHGDLELDGSRLRYTVDDEITFRGRFSEKGAAWLAKQTGDATVAERALRGEPVAVFDVHMPEAEVKFPKMGMGMIMTVKDGETKWNPQFTQSIAGGPGLLSLFYVAALVAGRRRAKPFRQALK